MKNNTEKLPALKAGDLDPSFGREGITNVYFPEFKNGQTRAVAKYQEDQLIVANWVNGACELFRLQSDGAVDRSFGLNGLVVVKFEDGFDSRVSRICVQDDGKLVLAGVSGPSTLSRGLPALARLDKDGLFDSTFGVGGKVVLQVRPENTVLALAGIDATLGAQGEILMTFPYYDVDAGGIGRGTTLLLAVGEDGTLRRTYPIQFQGNSTELASIALGTDGKLLVGGYITEYSGGRAYTRILLSRYREDGWLDHSFGQYGFMVFGPQNSGYQAFKILLQDDNKILVLGSNGEQALVMRFAVDGSPDADFNGGQPRLFDTDPFASWRSGAIQIDGKVVLAGQITKVPFELILGRILNDGSLDDNFGEGGWTKRIDGGVCWDMTIQKGGRLIVAGDAFFEKITPVVYGFLP